MSKNLGVLIGSCHGINILTDSGGFQIMSLGKNVKIDDEGVTFRSHLDGNLVRLNAEKSIEVQRFLGFYYNYDF